MLEYNKIQLRWVPWKSSKGCLAFCCLALQEAPGGFSWNDNARSYLSLFFLAGLGQFSLAVGHPTPVSQTYSHVQITIFFHSVDTLPSWRVWKFPNAFIHKTLRSVNRCLIFENIFCPPMLPVHFILKCGSTLSLSPLGGCLKIFLGECMWYRWISEESTRRLGFQLQG